MWSGGDNKVPPMSSAQPASSASAPASQPPDAKAKEAEAKAEEPEVKLWAPHAGSCFSMGVRAQAEVRLPGNKDWHPYFAELMREEFGISVPELAKPGKDPRIMCVGDSGDGETDRILVNQLEEYCADVAVRDLEISRDDAEMQCDAVIGKLEKTAAPTTGDKVLSYGVYGGATALGLLGTGWIFRTWKTFGDLARMIVDTFDFKLPPRGGAGHAGMPGQGGVSLSRDQIAAIAIATAHALKPSVVKPQPPEGGEEAVEEAAEEAAAEGAAEFSVLSVAASYASMKAQSMMDFALDTTAGNVVLGTAIGITILATAPVSVPAIIGGGAIYGGSTAMFSLVERSLLEDPLGHGPTDA